ncbi:MAG TPA: HlyD family secretion protein [Candidatus Saccharimonadales bacterium]|nr:HlyD family secretion protein [Candidatus Saccharimonadales bacterium]
MASPSQAPASHPAAATPAAVPPSAVDPHGQTRWPWLKYATPLFVLLLAGIVAYTLAHNWNGWEGGRAEQVTDDAFVRGDLTPLSTKVAGIVRDVKVNDYQKVQSGDLLVELQDDDYQAQLAQARAAVQAAHAAIQNNQKQRELQDARIDRALAGIDQAKSQIAAAQAGKEAAQADVTRTRAERTRQESLLANHAATQQHVESAIADEQRLAAQAAGREADFEQARTALRANEIAVEAERRGKGVLESQEQQLLADLHAKEAALSAAQINLGYTKIHAPAGGIVGERQVRTGQLVSPGMQVLTFVAENKWVQANYRETQLTHMKAGDLAEIRIDAYPDQVLRGKVLEIAPASGSQFALLPPDNASGNFTKVVQRIPVKISLDDAAQAARLRPGLSVTATVKTNH